MKVIHVPYCFAPDPVGGTEVYVAHVARDLQRLGVDAMVAAPSETSRAYTIDGLRVHRFATNANVTDVSEVYGEGDILATTEFAKILDDEKPDLVHLHSFTPAVSLKLVRAAKNRALPVVFTYHTPTVTCQRGTLLLWGKAFCDGKLDVRRCAGCTLNGLGMHHSSAAIVGRLSPIVGRWLKSRGLQGGVWTALRMSDLVSLRHTVFRQMASEVDHIVAVCKWVHELLLLNGIPAAKMSISRQGINWTPVESIALSPSSTQEGHEGVRLAFVGRLDPTKGLHVLINALQMVPTPKISLHVYGVVQNSANAAYREEMLALSSGDPRIAFQEPMQPGEVVARLRQYDFLVVPSQWLETGPLVALEAFAAGIPVIGWKVGGLVETVRHGVDGLLIDPGPIEHWAEALRCVTEDANLRARLKAGVRSPRSSMDVAHEMLALYNSVLRSSHSTKRVRVNLEPLRPT
jgi:glycosyltransferase involved in cell wall biosynthesis